MSLARKGSVGPAPRRWSTRCVLWAFAILTLAPTVRALEPANAHFRRVSVDDGLSQSSVTSIVQDRWGFMWFGSQDGLNRYDGRTLTVFRHDPEDPGSLSHNYVWALYLDRDDTLWTGTQGGGLSRWDPVTESFTHFRHDPDNPQSLASDRIRAITGDAQGRLWIGTEAGLDRLDPRTGAWKHFRHDPDDPGSLAHDSVLDVYIDRRGIVWVGTRGGLDRLDPGAESFAHYRHDPEDPNSLSNDRVRCILEDRSGRIWIGTYKGGLNRLDPERGAIVRFAQGQGPSSLSHDRVRAIFEDAEGRVWVGTDGGLNRWISDEKGFAVYRNDASDPYSLSADRVLSIFQDRGGVLWIATQDGLNGWNPAVTDFAHFRREADASSTLSSDVVMALSQDRDGIVWIGTYGGGLDALDRENDHYTHYRADPDDPGSLSDDRVMSLLHERSGALWVGTFDSGLNRKDPGSERFVHYRHDPDDPASLSANSVASIHEDASGTLWVGTYRGGLNKLNRSDGSYRRYRADPADDSSLSDDRVMVLASERDGTLWVGTEDGGLNRLDPVTGTFVRFLSDPRDPMSLGSNFIWSILEGRDGTLWIGAQSGGLHRWSQEDRRALRGRFKRYTEKDGLANGSIYGILEDRDGNLWLSTNHGVSRFDPRSETFTNYDTTHGLQSNEFNFGASFAGPGGEMLFGGNNGFNVFEPNRIDGNPYVPPIVLTGIFKLNERVRLDAPIPSAKHLTLGYKDYAVTFEFAALDFTAPERNRYAYKLEGLDADWIELGGSRRATYTNLPPGNYTFRVRGTNNDAVWNEEGAAIAVEVLPPPWRTWWAYGLYAAILVGGVLSYVRAQNRKLEREAQYSRKLEQTVAERTKELAKSNRDLAEASLTDALTGLRNRRYLDQFLEEDIALVDRRIRVDASGGASSSQTSPPDFLFMMIDLDNFKPVNDTYGHAAGDQVLCEVRDILRRVCRQSDTVIRWGGDEFLVVCRGVDRSAAEELSERILEAITRAPFDLGAGRSAPIGCSIGFAFYPFVPADPSLVPWERALAVADRALYMVKERGKSAWAGVVCTDHPIPGALVEAVEDWPDALIREGHAIVSSSLEVLRFSEARDRVPLSS